MAKKIQLIDLKVTSFVTTLNEKEQKTAKGGFWGSRKMPVSHRAGRADWTEAKTEFKAFRSSIYSRGNASSSGRRSI